VWKLIQPVPQKQLHPDGGGVWKLIQPVPQKQLDLDGGGAQSQKLPLLERQLNLESVVGCDGGVRKLMPQLHQKPAHQGVGVVENKCPVILRLHHSQEGVGGVVANNKLEEIVSCGVYVRVLSLHRLLVVLLLLLRQLMCLMMIKLGFDEN
jgi:hypothetical protein